MSNRAAVKSETVVKTSSIKWLAKKVTGQHSGENSFKDHCLTFDKGSLTGGEFTVDMTSLKVTDM